MFVQYDKLFDQVVVCYGVDKYMVVVVWGVESDYGWIFGKCLLLILLLILFCYGCCQLFFQGEFFVILKLLQVGDICDVGIIGFWVGVFGYIQFMLLIYVWIVVDFDGDGCCDLVGSVLDVFGFIVNYLKKVGWCMGQLWGYEVKVLVDFFVSLVGCGKCQLLLVWVVCGVRWVDGQLLLGGDEKVVIFLLVGVQGLVFLVYCNYDVIYFYNVVESYVLVIVLFFDCLCGGSGLVVFWLIDDLGISWFECK